MLLLADRPRRDRVDVRVVMAVVGADLEREEWMLLREVARNHQDRLAIVQIGGGGSASVLPLSASSSVATSPVR